MKIYLKDLGFEVINLLEEDEEKISIDSSDFTNIELYTTINSTKNKCTPIFKSIKKDSLHNNLCLAFDNDYKNNNLLDFLGEFDFNNLQFNINNNDNTSTFIGMLNPSLEISEEELFYLKLKYPEYTNYLKL